jgi:23S rRNA (uracil1939-C5)-methyltransferase
VAAASADGRENTARNRVDTIDFVTSTVQDIFTKQPLAAGLHPEADVIVDPPRSGLHPKALKGLVEWAPARLLYVSCNPARLQEEMGALTEVYRLESLRAFDLFPHTPHVEVVAAFRPS